MAIFRSLSSMSSLREVQSSFTCDVFELHVPLAPIRKAQFCRKENDSLGALIGGNRLVWNVVDVTWPYSLWNVYQRTLVEANCFRAKICPSNAIRSDRLVNSALQLSCFQQIGIHVRSLNELSRCGTLLCNHRWHLSRSNGTANQDARGGYRYDPRGSRHKSPRFQDYIPIIAVIRRLHSELGCECGSGVPARALAHINSTVMAAAILP